MSGSSDEAYSRRKLGAFRDGFNNSEASAVKLLDTPGSASSGAATGGLPLEFKVPRGEPAGLAIGPCKTASQVEAS